MINKLLGAAAMAAMIYPTVPASAANVAGCSGENLQKTESAVEAMTDGAGKFMAQREVAQAQDAMLNGKMSGCAMHLGRAMRAETMAQAPYAPTPAQAPYADTRAQVPYPDTMAQAPAGTAYQAPSQPTQGWQPVKPAL